MRFDLDSLAPLPRDFYDRSAATVAPQLLGKLLVRKSPQGPTAGVIVETEAYLPAGDAACHCTRGKTKSNAAMFGPPGTSYVYPIHAKWCFNVVVEAKGVCTAVLVRAVEPLCGIALMQRRRGREALTDLARGPARLCQAFDISRRIDGYNLCLGKRLWIAEADAALREREPDHIEAVDLSIAAGPRIGISADEHLPLRFFVAGSRFVSGPTKLNQPAVSSPASQER